MEVVVVMDVHSPATDIRDVNVESLQLGCLRLPDGFLAALVLVPDADASHGHAVHLLLVHVALVPGVRVRQVGIRLVRPHMQRALNLDAHVHVRQRGRDLSGCQFHAHNAQVARCLRGLVREVDVGAGHLNAVLDDLWGRKSWRLIAA